MMPYLPMTKEAENIIKAFELDKYENLSIVEGKVAGVKAEFIVSSHVTDVLLEEVKHILVPVAVLVNDDLFELLEIGNLPRSL